MNNLQITVSQVFTENFKTKPMIVRSPGRVNLIGEHTDYNGGFVLPAAIDNAIYFAIAAREDTICFAHAYDLKQSHQFSLDNLVPVPNQWYNYLMGVVAQLQTAGANLTGFDVVFGGDIPHGSGVSSSAAVECGTAFALNELFSLSFTIKDLAYFSQQAEHQFVGVKCGIMDQFASLFGKKNQVIKLDCRSLEYKYFPFNFPDCAIILCNSGVKHSLASSAYNTRREECEEAVSILKKTYPTIQYLRDVTPEMLAKQKSQLPDNAYLRAKYVVEEIVRVADACEALLKNDLGTFGQKMYETHNGLQHEYLVSCEELDFLVDQTRDNDAVWGARLMGGGFGGCTINLVKKTELATFLSDIRAAYFQKYDKKLEYYQVSPSDGVGLI